MTRSTNDPCRLRQVDVKAEHFERQVQRLEQERDQWEKKYEVRKGLAPKISTQCSCPCSTGSGGEVQGIEKGARRTHSTDGFLVIVIASYSSTRTWTLLAPIPYYDPFICFA